jgi:predicted nuclease of restriction endonuclease-like (RecB) superfamily
MELGSVRTLRHKIDSMMFERTAISKKSDFVIKAELATLRESDQMSADLVFKDPYLLSFLQLQDADRTTFERDIAEEAA